MRLRPTSGLICLAGSLFTRSTWSISASMARSRWWCSTLEGMAGTATVSSQRSTGEVRGGIAPRKRQVGGIIAEQNHNLTRVAQRFLAAWTP